MNNDQMRLLIAAILSLTETVKSLAATRDGYIHESLIEVENNLQSILDKL